MDDTTTRTPQTTPPERLIAIDPPGTPDPLARAKAALAAMDARLEALRGHTVQP